MSRFSDHARALAGGWTCPDCRATVARYVEGEGEMAEWEIEFLHECEGHHPHPQELPQDLRGRPDLCSVSLSPSSR